MACRRGAGGVAGGGASFPLRPLKKAKKRGESGCCGFTGDVRGGDDMAAPRGGKVEKANKLNDSPARRGCNDLGQREASADREEGETRSEWVNHKTTEWDKGYIYRKKAEKLLFKRFNTMN